MWIIPSTCSVSAPDTEGLNWDSNDWGYICAQSLTWRGKDSPARTWSQRWKRVPWMRHLSLRTLRPSHTQNFVAAWISSLRATRVSRSVQPENAKEQTIPVTCGPTSQGEFSFAGPDGSSAKTSKATSRWDSPQSLATWKKWVTERRGTYSQRLKSAHRTNGNGCLSWLTPVTPAPHDSENSVGNPAIKKRQKELCHQVAMWPTCSARDWKDTPGMSKERDGKELGRIDQLPRAVYHYGQQDQANRNTSGKSPELWETPNGMGGGKVSRGGKRKGELLLAGQVKHYENWPTPVANDDNKSPEAHIAMKERMGGNRTAITSLNVKVKAESSNWATPQTRDFRGADPARHRNPQRTKNLNDQACQKNGKLNPDWVEQLMGLPVGWTDFDFSVMELSPPPLPKPLQRSTKNFQEVSND